MKKANKKHLLASVICVFALVLLLTINIYAASQDKYVAEVNSVKYENYEDAWEAVEDGGTITMLNDWHTNEALVVDGVTITVNMNGFMINRGRTSSTSNGEVFWVKDDSVLNINGEKNPTTEHKGTIQADMWHYNANGNHVIKGALITGGYSSNGGGAIHIKENAIVNINNVTIAGNATSDGEGAGAIKLDSDSSTVTLQDSEICYNKATGGGGGAIRVEGEYTNVQILGTKINNNVVTKGSCDGGAIQINNGTVTIARSNNRVSEISFNTTTRNGGAIYVSNGNLILNKNTIIARNNAGKEGGAIYVNSDADNIEIKGIFTGNFAIEEGGAIYVNSNVSGNNGVKISDAEFLGNRAHNNGGAIYVDADNNIALSGKVIANGNTPNNLYIQNQSTIFSNTLESGSKVGITTSWKATSTNPIYTTNNDCFVSDNMEYEMAGTSNSMYFVEANLGPLENITVSGESFPVTKGVFAYNAVVGEQMTAYFYYSDGYFADSARYYNEHLVTMSSCVAVAGVTSAYTGQYTEEKGSKNIVDLFTSAGFTNIYVHYPKPEFFGADCEIISTIGYVIASREITIDGVTQTLIAVALRGGAYADEWASNFILGDGVGEAKIFSHIADQLEEELYDYIDNYGLNPGESKFWISGFSRGGATTNLLAKRLTDRYGEDDIYAFCFEAPKGGVYSELKDGYTYANIHCILNPTDIVPQVGTTEMGFIRYGVDHYMPKYQVGTSEYEEQKKKMLEQFAAVDPEAVFKDDFHEATIEYLESAFGYDLIQKVSSPNYTTAAQWNPVFINKIQEYSFTNNVKDSIYNKDSVNWYGYRNFWSTYKWYLYEENGDLLLKCYDTEPSDFSSGKYTVLTLEDTVVNIMHFYYSGDTADIKNALDFDAIMSKIDKNGIYWNIVGKWNGFSIDEKNEKFNDLWKTIDIETSLASILTPDELKTVKTSIFVAVDFMLDFLSDDYDNTDQNLLGTLIYNASAILQTHNYENLIAWTRSFDSFYASGDIVAPPSAPVASVPSGTYPYDINVHLKSDNSAVTFYYTYDGTDPYPGAENCNEYILAIPIWLDDNHIKDVTIKAIAFYNGVASEVVTYHYTVTTNAQIEVKDEAVHVSNLMDSAYLILAEYKNGALLDIEHYPVTNNSVVLLANSSLNFNNTVMAYVVKDIKGYAAFNPLSDVFCLTDDQKPKHNVNQNAQNLIVIESFEAKQAENPEYIDITFSIIDTNAQFLMVTLFDKEKQSDFNDALYFGKLEMTDDNTYRFTIKRSRWLEVINSHSIKGRSLVLTVAANGIPEKEAMEGTCEETVYTITYHLNGGTNNSINPITYTMSDEIVLRNPTKEHYNFVSWYTNEYLDDGYDIWVIPVGTYGNIDLYAKWDAKLYSVTYTDGVDSEEIFPTKYLDAKYNSRTPSFGENPTRDGYVFVGWDKEVSPTVTGDVIYNAVWEKIYTITYHLNGGTNNEKNPNTFTRLDEFVIYNPTREGYYFKGWYDNKYFDGTDIWVLIAGTEQNVELYAKWTIKTYTVAYIDGVDGEEIFPHQIYEVDHNSKTPSFKGIPQREGYDFVGWDKEISETVTCDVDYIAVWKKHVHKPILINGVEATCVAPGYKPYYECENCGYFEDEACTVKIADVELWKQTDGKTTADHKIDTNFTTMDGQHYHVCLQDGCDYTTEKVPCSGGVATCTSKAICSTCGSEYGDVAPHDYKSVVTKPTCTTEGYTTHICSVCDDTYTDSAVGALGHSYDTVVTEPTCTTDGYTTHTCSVCEDTYTDSVVEALGHSYASTVTKPTCTTDGYTTHTCSVCEDTYTDSVVEALGHDFTEATTVSPKTCKNCGLTEGEKLPENENGTEDKNQKSNLFEILLNWFVEAFYAIGNFFKLIGDFFVNCLYNIKNYFF